MVEYTDPNPFKVFHIGHLMTNIIGESLSRVCAFSGGEVRRANYQGDVGLHVAKTLWAVEEKGFDVGSVEELGKAYTYGSAQYEENETATQGIIAMNKRIYAKDPGVMAVYTKGRETSLAHFEELYKILGTHFDFYFFESEVWEQGKALVEQGFEKGIFEKSDGAVVFPGEKHGLHTRVFLNSAGLPTYEAKELALAKCKFDRYPYNASVIVTANELVGYAPVLLKAMSFVYPDLAQKTRFVLHGLLSLTTGKMSSRKGNVITGESLLNDSIALAESKMKYDEGISEEEKKKIATTVGVAALKYAILKQAIGKNIIYDTEKSFSFEGDSGPYLQYACVRAQAVLAKADVENEASLLDVGRPKDEEVSLVERLLYQFPDVVVRSLEEYEPHHILTYLTELAGAFNNYYASTHILGEGDKTAYRLALTHAVVITLKNGLYLLGMETPERM